MSADKKKENPPPEEDFEDDEPEGFGTPPWMLTFADLASLLLTFFVLIFSFGSLNEEIEGVGDIISFSRYVSFGAATIGGQGAQIEREKYRKVADKSVQRKELSLDTHAYFYNLFRGDLALQQEDGYGNVEKDADADKLKKKTEEDEDVTATDFKRYFFRKKLDKILSVERGNSPSDYSFVFSFKDLFKQKSLGFNINKRKQFDNLVTLINKTPNDIEIEYFADETDKDNLGLSRIEKLVKYLVFEKDFIKERLYISFYNYLFSKEEESEKDENKDGVAKLKNMFDDTEKKITRYLDNLGGRKQVDEDKIKAEAKRRKEARIGVIRVKVRGSFIGYQVYKLNLAEKQ